MMKPYWTSNWGLKLATFLRARARITNWPTAVSMRLRPGWTGMRMLQFRSGLRVICRSGTKDWDVVSELALQGGYALALDHLSRQQGHPVVLDLGGNIGMFSLIAAIRHKNAVIHTYEPAPLNMQMLQANCLINHEISGRIQARREAVGGTSRMASFLYDLNDPSSSRFDADGAECFPVQVRAFSEVLASLGQPVALVKMDIESAEYELVENTPAQAWEAVQAVSVEIHDDSADGHRIKGFLEKMRSLGYRNIVKESTAEASYFISRTDG